MAVHILGRYCPMTVGIKGRITLRMSESASVGEVLSLVGNLQATAELVSVASNPDDSVEVAVETPAEVATFFEKLQGIDSARQVDEDPRGTPIYEVTMGDLIASPSSPSARQSLLRTQYKNLHRFVHGLPVAVHHQTADSDAPEVAEVSA